MGLRSVSHIVRITGLENKNFLHSLKKLYRFNIRIPGTVKLQIQNQPGMTSKRH